MAAAGITLGILYLAVCFGAIAKRTGRNPFLWGVVSVVSPVNAAVLGYWAWTGRLPFDARKAQ
jgi:hypothetical protein